MKITTIDKEIREILCAGFYKIPRFQRPYSWDKENVSDFWNDVIVDSDKDYFIGSIVAFKCTDSLLGIVDGQQRLTTLTMILCAVRNALKEYKFDSLSQGVHNFIERADVNNQLRFVLETETSYPYLQEHIQKNGSPDEKVSPGVEEELLADAFGYFKKNIQETINGIKADKTLGPKNTQEKIKEKLLEIRDKILQLKLIFITLDNEDDAYIIFETLNTRGKDLRVTDLVKNYVTKMARPKTVGVDLVKDKWNKIVEIIDDSQVDLDIDVFIQYFWLSKYDFITLKKLYKEIRKKINKTNAKEFLDDLYNDARTFREINETSYRKWQKNEIRIKESLQAISLFRVKQAMPMLLSIMREYREKRLGQKETEKILKSIENFHFIFTAITSQRSSGGISFMYAKAGRELLEASLQRKNGVLLGLSKKLIDKLPPYQEFEANFCQLKFSDEFTKQKKLVQYILAKIDSFHSDGVAVDYEKMTIEHIGSQNTNTSILKLEEVASIGNLLLVNSEMNSKLGNKTFSFKKNLLEKSKVTQDQWLSKATVWGAKQIKEREKGLAKLAFNKIWKI